MRRHLKIVLSLVFLFLAQTSCVQDCMGITFSVSGYVVDSQGHSISNAKIVAYNAGSYEKPPFNVTSTSDQNGYFSTDEVFSYGCTSFNVEISALNYETKTFTYYPPANEGWPDELPKTLRLILNPVNN